MFLFLEFTCLMTTILITKILSLTSCIVCVLTILIMARLFLLVISTQVSYVNCTQTMSNLILSILCNFVDQCNLLTPLIEFDVHGESFSFVSKQTMLDYILLFTIMKFSRNDLYLQHLITYQLYVP